MADGWHLLPRPAGPVTTAWGTEEGSIMAYIPPWLDQPLYSGLEVPRHKVSRLARLGQILTIGVAVGLVGFLVALITAIVTAGGG
jgi:hypothetical protein